MMKTLKQFGGAVLFVAGAVLSADPAWAADAPATAEVLGKLHASNRKEIDMGKMAQKSGQSKEVKDFGKTLVKDHTAADKKVLGLAKKQKIELPAPPPMQHDDMTGADFDKKFAQSMLDDHKKDVSEATAARDSTADTELKKLLTDLVPTLQKHLDTAQKLADAKK